MAPSTSLKKTEVVKTTLCEGTHDALQAKARLAGCEQLSEYIRDLIYMDLHGVTYGEHIAKHRRAVIGLQVSGQAYGGTTVGPVNLAAVVNQNRADIAGGAL